MYMMKYMRFASEKRRLLWRILGIVGALFFICAGVFVLWVASLKLPSISTIPQRALASSTKIYDRNGVLLYDLNQNSKQQVVAFDQISPYLKEATVAIEDPNFYNDYGVEPMAILRAMYVDILTGSFKEGGSTITQQVVKNTLLTDNKSLIRKIEEAILAVKLNFSTSKDNILNLYLNSSPYGGNLYGVEEAAQTYFATSSANVDLAQAAYIAALPQAPTYYSPYGQNRAALDARKNLVLQKMLQYGYITQAQYTQAVNEQVVFQPQQNQGIKAPAFVMFIKNYLIQKYGQDVVNNDGLQVTTTLDYNLQKQAQQIVHQYALENVKKFDATNAGMVAIDPTTGQILVMVGSRNYFSKNIDGQYNVTTALRQPGSTFKPFVYETAFEEGYTPNTVVFDVPTQFSTSCTWQGIPLSSTSTNAAPCYSPVNYDNKFLGPISFRDALAQSRNVPSVKVLYLAGLDKSLQTAQNMGISTLSGADKYGLTLVLGGGEVTLLQMTSAYGVFADNGIRNPYTGILKIEDKYGHVLEQYQPDPQQVLPLQPTLELNNVLSDNNARMPLNGPGSATDFPNRDVALKTGTTNDDRDTWTIGYTPQIVVGVWAGNNNNTPMHQISGLIAAPMWRAFMNVVLDQLPQVNFQQPNPINPNLKPILRGFWQGNQTYFINKTSGQLATSYTPAMDRKEVSIPNIHNILYWVNPSDPTGPPPTNPALDPQYNLWEPAVQQWVSTHMNQLNIGPATPPTQTDTFHTAATIPTISITSPQPNSTLTAGQSTKITLNYHSVFPITQADLYFNGNLIDTQTTPPFSFRFTPQISSSTISSSTSSSTPLLGTISVDVVDMYDNTASTSLPVYISN